VLRIRFRNVYHVVGRAGKREDPIDFQRSAMPHFAEQRNGLQPADRFFDALPLFLGGGLDHYEEADKRHKSKQSFRHGWVKVFPLHAIKNGLWTYTPLVSG
jgi:hypothetical protein